MIGPIPWGHSGPLCHALSLSSLSSWTSLRRRRATVQWRHLVNWREAARGEWAQHLSNALCISKLNEIFPWIWIWQSDCLRCLYVERRNVWYIQCVFQSTRRARCWQRRVEILSHITAVAQWRRRWQSRNQRDDSRLCCLSVLTLTGWLTVLQSPLHIYSCLWSYHVTSLTPNDFNCHFNDSNVTQSASLW